VLRLVVCVAVRLHVTTYDRPCGLTTPRPSLRTDDASTVPADLRLPTVTTTTLHHVDVDNIDAPRRHNNIDERRNAVHVFVILSGSFLSNSSSSGGFWTLIQQECGSSAFLPLLSFLFFQQRFGRWVVAALYSIPELSSIDDEDEEEEDLWRTTTTTDVAVPRSSPS